MYSTFIKIAESKTRSFLINKIIEMDYIPAKKLVGKHRETINNYYAHMMQNLVNNAINK